MALEQLTDKNSLALIQESFTKYVVKPLNAFGLGGFVFDIDGEQVNKLEADITDHYVEDNSAVQDHIARKPIEVTLRNYVGEIVRTDQDSFQRDYQNVVQKLTTVAGYAPDIISSASNIKNLIQDGLTDFETLTSYGVDLWTLTKNLNPSASKQQKAYLFFKSLYDQNIIVGLQTPWEFIPNMAIKTLVATQTDRSTYITDFTITLKQIRTTSTEAVLFDKDKLQGRLKAQKQAVSKKGKNTGKEASLLKNIGSIF